MSPEFTSLTWSDSSNVEGDSLPVLDDTEIRVTASLMEKEVTTPDYYPLTRNALVNACNQKSSRNPVVAYDDNTVADTIHRLREKRLLITVTGPDLRVPKYKQSLSRFLNLNDRQFAVLTVLMLRGSMTPGEIRGSTGRMYDFSSLEEVNQTLEDLQAHPKGALVKSLPRQPGRKENRFVQLLGDTPCQDPEPGQGESSPVDRQLTVDPPASHINDRLADELAELRAELDALRNEFEIFKRQFE